MTNGYDNTNSGALFKNDRKESDKQPTHRGNINVAGVDYWLSAWVKEKDGKRYFSLAVTPKVQAGAQPGAGASPGRPAPAPRPASQTRKADDLDDEIPW